MFDFLCFISDLSLSQWITNTFWQHHRECSTMGHGSYGSWVKYSVGRMGHGSLEVTHRLPCCKAANVETMMKRCACAYKWWGIFIWPFQHRLPRIRFHTVFLRIHWWYDLANFITDMACNGGHDIHGGLETTNCCCSSASAGCRKKLTSLPICMLTSCKRQ